MLQPHYCLPSQAGEARQQAAKMFDTNARYVSDAKKLKEEAPDLFQEVCKGEKELTQAKADLKQRTQEQENQF